MDLRFYLDILKRRALYILVVVTMSLVITVAVGLYIRPMYRATSTVRVLIDLGLPDLTLREEYNQRLIGTYMSMLETDPALTGVIDSLSPLSTGRTPSSIRDNLTIEQIPNTELITISVVDRNPKLARDMANQLAQLVVEYAQSHYADNGNQILLEQIAALEAEIETDIEFLGVLSPDDPQTDAHERRISTKTEALVELRERHETFQLVEALRANSVWIEAQASLPSTPVNALKISDIAIGAAIGVACGLGLALVLENVDIRIYTTRQLEQLFDIPVLGVVHSYARPVGTFGVGRRSHKIQLCEESYRILVNTLLFSGSQHDAQNRTFLITSADRQEGKSVVAVNLAQAFVERGLTAFLVEGNLRHPNLARLLDMEHEQGLGTLLELQQDPDEIALRNLIHATKQPGMYFVDSGRITANPTVLLASPNMDRALNYFDEHSQITLVDTSPLNTADTIPLALKVDGVLLVVREGVSDREKVWRAIKQLIDAQAHLIGLVFVLKQ